MAKGNKKYDFSAFDNAVKTEPKKEYDFSSFDNTVKKKVDGTTEQSTSSDESDLEILSTLSTSVIAGGTAKPKPAQELQQKDSKKEVLRNATTTVAKAIELPNKNVAPWDIRKQFENAKTANLKKIASSEASPIERAEYSKRNPLYQQLSESTVEEGDYATGIDFWLVPRESKMETFALGNKGKVTPSASVVAPKETGKVLDDYMKYLIQANPEKAKSYNLVAQKQGQRVPFYDLFTYGGNGYELKDKSLAPFIKLSDYAGTATTEESRKEGVFIQPMNKEQEAALLMEAFNHQREILKSQFTEQYKKEGNKIDEAGLSLTDKYLMAYNKIGEKQKEIFDANPALQKPIDDEIERRNKIESEQKVADDLYNMYYEKSPIQAGIYYNLGRPVSNSLTSTLKDLYQIPRALGIEDLDAITKWADNSFKEDIDPTALQGDLSWTNLTPRLVGTLTDMTTLLAGGSALSKSLNVSYRAGLFGSSYVQTYNDYYNEAYDALINEGVSPTEAQKQANNHATRAALTTSALELASPNINLVGGNKTKLLKAIQKEDGVGTFLKQTAKEIGKENVQEILQGLGDKYNNKITNDRSGTTALEEEYTSKELFETVVLTSIVTGLANLKGYKPTNTLQNNALWMAYQDPQGFDQLVDQAVAKNDIEESEAKTIKKNVEEMTAVINGIPENIKLDENQKITLAGLLYEKKQIEDAAKKISVDPLFAERKEKEIAGKIEKIDTKINGYLADVKKQREIEKVYKEQQEAAEKDIVEGKEANAKYDEYVTTIYKESPDQATFVDRMMEEEYEGGISEEQARKFYADRYNKIKNYDSEKRKQVSGEIRKREEPEQTELVIEESQTPIETGGVLQMEEQEEVTKKPIYEKAKADEENQVLKSSEKDAGGSIEIDESPRPLYNKKGNQVSKIPEINEFEKGIKQGLKEGKIQQKEMTEKLSDFVKNSPLSAKIPVKDVRRLVQTARKVTTEAQFNRFINTYNNIVTAAQNKEVKAKDKQVTKEKIGVARKTQKQIRRAGKNALANQKVTAKEFNKIDPRTVPDIDAYNDVSKKLLDVLRGTSLSGRGLSRSETDITMNEVREYMESLPEPTKLDWQEKYQAYIDAGIIDPAFTKTEEAALQLIEEYENSKLSDRKAAIAAAREQLITEINDKKKQVDLSDFDATEMQDAKVIMAINPETLSAKEITDYNDVLNNMIDNGSIDGAGDVIINQMMKDGIESIKQGKEKYGIKEIPEFYGDINQLFKAIKTWKEWRSTQPMLLKAITRHNKLSALIRQATGMQTTWANSSTVNREMDELIKGYDALMDKNTRSGESILRRGVAAFVIQDRGVGTEAEDFQMYKKACLEAIDAKGSRAKTKEEKTRYAMEKEAYNSIVADANSVSEVMNNLSPKERAILEYFKNHFAGKFNQLDYTSRVYLNKTLNRSKNYLPIVTKTQEEATQDVTPPDEQARVDMFLEGVVNTRAAGATIDRGKVTYSEKSPRLPDFDFDYNMIKKAREASYQIETLKDRQLAGKILNNAGFKEQVGTENAKLIRTAFNRGIQATLGMFGGNSNFANTVSRVSSKLSKRAAGIALSSPFQIIKQVGGVMSGLVVNLKGRGGLIFTSPTVTVESNIFKYSNIKDRITTQFNTEAESLTKDADKIGGSTWLKRRYEGLGNIIDKTQKVAMKPLTGGDAWIAKKAWLAYYKDFLRKEKKDFNWDNEILEPSLEASAYADQMVETTQNINQQALSSEALTRRGGFSDLFKNLYFSFAAFSINQRRRLAVNTAQLFGKAMTKEQRLEGLRENAAIITEQTVFQGTRIGIAYLATLGARELYQSLTGADDEKAEEAIKWDWNEQMLRAIATVGKDITVAGMGDPVDKAGSELFNWLYKEGGGTKDIFYVPSNEEKPWLDWGSYSVVFGTYGKMVDDMWALTVGKQKVKKGGMGDKAEFENYELTDDEKESYALFVAWDIANAFGINFQEVGTIMRKTQRAIDKDMELGSTWSTTVSSKGKKSNAGGTSRTRSNIKRNIKR